MDDDANYLTDSEHFEREMEKDIELLRGALERAIAALRGSRDMIAMDSGLEFIDDAISEGEDVLERT